MHVLSLALDPKVLDPESVVAFRARAYGNIVDHYSIAVVSPETVTVKLSDTTTAHGIGGKHKLVKLIQMYRFASKFIREKKCEVITSQDMYFLGLVGLVLARRYHLGLEVQVLGIEKLSPFRKRLAMFVMKRASVVRALSARIQQRLITEFNIPAEKIVIVPIYVNVNQLGLDIRTLKGEDAKRYEALSTDFKKKYGGNINFLSVSRLVPIKRIEMHLTALQNILPEAPHVMLHIVGTGPEEEALRQKVATLGLDAHVIFHGYQTGYALGMFYIECDCFLLTSDYEGWGMVIVEAASAGIPIIMTDVGCAGELIVDTVSGLVIPTNDVQALSTAMLKVVKNPIVRDTLSTGATTALAHLPSFDDVLAQYKQNWERALANRL